MEGERKRVGRAGKDRRPDFWIEKGRKGREDDLRRNVRVGFRT
jgi:hypothetical protein